ncbi:ceramide-1-phosphate transfer protein-like [Mytilus galloprovincialis]|uniref:ceramide-1-phosphate transfer protein-like n=1 Tax=Mytilus galloprovincialis TaxID=29158 RepID=UPI003F7CA5CD
MNKQEIMFDTEQKDFDLEKVLELLKKCKLDDDTILLEYYIKAYRELCRFFRLQGRLFGFVAKDLEEKIGILETWRRCDTCDNYKSVQSMIKYEVEYGLTTFRGRVPSGSRTLLRLQRALEFILRFIDEMSMSEDEDKSSYIAHTVYKRTLANHHPWIVQKMAGFVTFMLPSRKELIETMCKQKYDQVLILMHEVTQEGNPIYDITHSLYKKHNLLNLK